MRGLWRWCDEGDSGVGAVVAVGWVRCGGEVLDPIVGCGFIRAEMRDLWKDMIVPR